jgi:hypothetical protein
MTLLERRWGTVVLGQWVMCMRHEIVSLGSVLTSILSMFFATPALAQCGEQPEPPDIDPQCIAWGAPAEGLQFGICPGDTLVRQGDVVTFHVAFRLDPSVPPPAEPIRHFARVAADHTTFEFIDAANDSFHRSQTIFHGPPIVAVGFDREPLQPGRPVWGLCRVALTTPWGEQLPAGLYRVHAVYDNRPPSRPQRQSLKDQRFWSGVLTSAVRTLHVESARPELVDLRVNSMIQLCSTEKGLGYSWSEEDPVLLRVFRRPGYTITRVDRVWARVGDAPFEGIGGVLGGSPWIAGERCRFSPVLQPGAQVRAEVMIVESAVGGYAAPMWKQQGDQRILYKATCTAISD